MYVRKKKNTKLKGNNITFLRKKKKKTVQKKIDPPKVKEVN